jgi:GT2 family glycosyltransferase
MTAGRPPSISAVIATARRRGPLERCVDAVLADPGLAELVVVVDGGRDGSLEWVRARGAQDARVRTVWREGIGAPRARTAGVQEASGEVVLFLDDDVVAGPGLATGHARHHRDRPDLVVLGYMPVSLPPARRPGQVATYLYAQEYEEMCRRYERDPAAVLGDLWMGNVSVRRKHLLRVPPSSEAYGTIWYHEDRDFGLRLRTGGLVGRFDRSLAAEHHHERSLAGFAAGARSQGEGHVALSALHPGAVGPLDLERFSAGVPGPVRRVLRFARRPRARHLVRAGLLGTAHAAGRAHLWPAETAAARVLRRVEQQQGAFAEAARRGYRGTAADDR